MSEGHTGFINNWKQLLAVGVAAFVVPVLLIIGIVQLITGGMQTGAGAPGMSEEATAERIKPVGEVNIAAAGSAPAPEAAAPDAGAAAAPAAAAPAPGGTPSADTAGTPAAAPAPAAAARSGEQVYQQACMACHASGLAGAPKVGDAAAWKPRVAQGKQTLYDHAIKGIRAMPAKGGNPSLPDAEVQAAVDYMVAQAK